MSATTASASPHDYSLHHFQTSFSSIHSKTTPISDSKFPSPRTIAQTWLDAFNSALNHVGSTATAVNGNTAHAEPHPHHTLSSLFHLEAWWRDHLALSLQAKQGSISQPVFNTWVCPASSLRKTPVSATPGAAGTARSSRTTPYNTRTCTACPSPKAGPLFTPNDKLADWFEAYASIMELKRLDVDDVSSGKADDDSTHQAAKRRTLHTPNTSSSAHRPTPASRRSRDFSPAQDGFRRRHSYHASQPAP
ncbi:Flavin-binding monooxygenase [Lasiodiplodia theobromae]|uniref:Flavin-binding monooxygenase n=1 Tax=Lasiodiplodia theobromae TaxID=45133 RepID=UPI0015C36385|nr:Flavin-binding monooxygenase [Lasiodiplodia theobromae]KAF4538117.1 Flavin-binding monooxygenase [Lasiodiplodia theobromae]